MTQPIYLNMKPSDFTGKLRVTVRNLSIDARGVDGAAG